MVVAPHFFFFIFCSGEHRRCITAGPIFDAAVEVGDPKAAPMGSVVFFNADNDEHARETTDNDPYNEAGLFESVFIARCVCVRDARVCVCFGLLLSTQQPRFQSQLSCRFFNLLRSSSTRRKIIKH